MHLVRHNIRNFIKHVWLHTQPDMGGCDTAPQIFWGKLWLLAVGRDLHKPCTNVQIWAISDFSQMTFLSSSSLIRYRTSSFNVFISSRLGELPFNLPISMWFFFCMLFRNQMIAFQHFIFYFLRFRHPFPHDIDYTFLAFDNFVFIH